MSAKKAKVEDKSVSYTERARELTRQLAALRKDIGVGGVVSEEQKRELRTAARLPPAYLQRAAQSMDKYGDLLGLHHVAADAIIDAIRKREGLSVVVDELQQLAASLRDDLWIGFAEAAAHSRSIEDALRFQVENCGKTELEPDLGELTRLRRSVAPKPAKKKAAAKPDASIG